MARDAIPVERIAVVGLGYVGLQLATAFGRILPTIGFDIDKERVRSLRDCTDPNGEISPEALRAPGLLLTDDYRALEEADFFIVAVPTPVDRANRPDLSHLMAASRIIAQALRAQREQTPRWRKPIVVYESTVFPGCTEEVCIPVLEQESGLSSGRDFKVAYSPERINPGDPEHTLATVVKVVAGQDPETTEATATVYELVVKAGVYRTTDIRTAEAAKVIENVQRDLNVALMNELAILFHRLALNTKEVLRAAGTKWNFLPFEPGLVGGHCIPVDPYYLTHKAQEIGYHTEVILAGRRINDSMGIYVAGETVKQLIQAGGVIRGARVLVLGVAFKENVRDARNTRVVDLVRELENHGIEVFVHDPLVDPGVIQRLGLRPSPNPFEGDLTYDAVVLAVPHRVFRERSIKAYLRVLGNDSRRVLIDVKGVLAESVRGANISYWRL